MTPLPPEIEERIERMKERRISYWGQEAVAGDLREMAEFDREYYGKRIAQLEAVVEAAKEMRDMYVFAWREGGGADDTPDSVDAFDAALAARKGE